MAQAQAPGTRDSVVWAALARLRPGKEVRLHTAELGRLEGRLLSLSDSAVTVGMSPAETSVALAEIDTLWQRGSAAKTGAIVGGIVGGLAGAVGGALITALDYSYDTGPGAGAAGGGAIGVVTGALLGGAIGAVIPRWRRRMP
jgi:hypothetical protein